MGFRLTSRSMTLDDLELHKFAFSVNFAGFRRFRTQQQIGQYCQRQRCKHVELEQVLVGFRVARVCQRQLGFVVSIIVCGYVYLVVFIVFICPLQHFLQYWIGLCSVLRTLQHSIGYMGDGFYRSKDPTNSIKVLKESTKENKDYTKNIIHTEIRNSTR